MKKITDKERTAFIVNLNKIPSILTEFKRCYIRRKHKRFSLSFLIFFESSRIVLLTHNKNRSNILVSNEFKDLLVIMSIKFRLTSLKKYPVFTKFTDHKKL